MSDLREQLRKAGLVSDKQVRQARHQERVLRKEIGHQGLEQKQAEIDLRYREELEEKRRLDRQREEARRQAQAEAEQAESLARRIRAGWMREATGGNRRFFFLAEGARITYLDLADPAIRRLQGGSAAIVESRGVARGEYCVVDGNTAASLARDHAEVIRYWAH